MPSSSSPQYGIHPEIWSLLPHDDCSSSALALAHASLPAPLLNHSLRVYLYTQWLCIHGPKADSSAGDDNDGERDLDFDIYEDPLYSPLIFTACILHDVGLASTPTAQSSSSRGRRFEVAGADTVKKHLLSYGFLELEAHNAWVAVALHTSPGIAERIGPLARLVRLAVRSDFSEAVRAAVGASAHGEFLEGRVPRLEAERCLGDAVVAQVGKEEEQALEGAEEKAWVSTERFPAGSWPGILWRARREDPRWEGVNPAF